MEITWLGHSCFRLKGKDITLITDPYEKSLGYDLGRQAANIVTISHQHAGHYNVAAIGGSPKVLNGPGEYEISHVLITGLPTFHDAQRGKSRGKNTIYIIEMDDIRIGHLGDLGHVPSPTQIEEMSDVDVLMVPVGGVSTIDAAAAAETVSLLEPKLVIPMHFKTEATTQELEALDKFIKEMGLREIVPQPKLTVSRSGLPAETQVVVLDYRR